MLNDGMSIFEILADLAGDFWFGLSLDKQDLVVDDVWVKIRGESNERSRRESAIRLLKSIGGCQNLPGYADILYHNAVKRGVYKGISGHPSAKEAESIA